MIRILFAITFVVTLGACGIVSDELLDWKRYVSDVILGIPERHAEPEVIVPVTVESDGEGDEQPGKSDIEVPTGIY